MSGDSELIERFCSPQRPTIGCWALTEPDHGSDTVGSPEAYFSDPARRPNCIARADGSDFVISGQKAAWVSNGSIADLAVVFCAFDDGSGSLGGSVFVVPMDLPGVDRPPPLDKLGQRSLNQGEIFFNDVRVPASHRVVDPELYPLALEGMLAFANAAMGQLFVGVARSAYELALDYAKDRVQGGPADLRTPERARAPVRHVHPDRGGAGTGAPCRCPQRGLGAGAAVLDRHEGVLHADRLRRGDRRAADIRRQRTDPRVPDREDPARRTSFAHRRRLQRGALPRWGLKAVGGIVELYEAIGRRRSIRFLLPFRPVEPEKIQCMLEAARLASHWGNVASLRALVIERDHASQEVLDALPSPVSGYQVALAPVVIVWYIETGATAKVGDRLRELVDIGAVGYGDDKREEAETQLIPIMEAAGEVLREPGLGEVDCGQGIAQATLVATSLGLGTLLSGFG